MSAKVLMGVDEYLKTSFDDGDCEYLDGEVVERNMGEMPHADVQYTLGRLLWPFRRRFGIRILPEIRTRISPTRYRIPDLAVYRNDNIGDRIPTVPPFLAIEILSPEDRMARIRRVVDDYIALGVPVVWILDPLEKRAYVADAESGLRDVVSGILEAAHVSLTTDEVFSEEELF